MNDDCVRYALSDLGTVVRFSAGASDFLLYSVSSSYRPFQWGSFPCGKSGAPCQVARLSSAGINARSYTSGVSWC